MRRIISIFLILALGITIFVVINNINIPSPKKINIHNISLNNFI